MCLDSVGRSVPKFEVDVSVSFPLRCSLPSIDPAAPVYGLKPTLVHFSNVNIALVNHLAPIGRYLMSKNPIVCSQVNKSLTFDLYVVVLQAFSYVR